MRPIDQSPRRKENKPLTQSQEEVLHAMSRRQVLQEDLTKSDRAITCGPLVVRRNVLTGLLKRGEIVQDRQEWPIRYFRLAR